MSFMTKFTDIGQFRNVIRDIRYDAQFVGKDENNNSIMDRNARMPTVVFKGTPKIHGTNASVVIDATGKLWCQSRERIITPQDDNAGFAFFVSHNEDVFRAMVDDVRSELHLTTESVAIYGEWAGGNIQKGVAVSGLDKFMAIFAVKIIPSDEGISYYTPTSVWGEFKAHDRRIYNINDFGSWFITIDFDKPEFSQNTMIEITNAVEAECPVGKYFGRVLGTDNTVGEGVVWEGWYKEQRHIFKVKGEKHSVTKVKTLASVDVERLENIDKFVEYAVTENRLNQGVDVVFTQTNTEPVIEKMGVFLKWVSSDVIKEESDTMVENGLEPKDIGGALSKKARLWFMDYLNARVGL